PTVSPAAAALPRARTSGRVLETRSPAGRRRRRMEGAQTRAPMVLWPTALGETRPSLTCPQNQALRVREEGAEVVVRAGRAGGVAPSRMQGRPVSDCRRTQAATGTLLRLRARLMATGAVAGSADLVSGSSPPTRERASF